MRFLHNQCPSVSFPYHAHSLLSKADFNCKNRVAYLIHGTIQYLSSASSISVSISLQKTAVGPPSFLSNVINHEWQRLNSCGLPVVRFDGAVHPPPHPKPCTNQGRTGGRIPFTSTQVCTVKRSRLGPLLSYDISKVSSEFSRSSASPSPLPKFPIPGFFTGYQ